MDLRIRSLAPFPLRNNVVRLRLAPKARRARGHARRLAMDDMNGMVFWGLLFVGCLALLGGAMFFFGDRKKPLSPAEREHSDQVARENWGKENVR